MIDEVLSDIIVARSYHKFVDKPLYEEYSYLIKDNIFIHIHSDIFLDIMFFHNEQTEYCQDLASMFNKIE